MTYQESTFVRVGYIRLDGNEFIDCRFDDCTLVFGATAPVTLDGCTFGPGVRWAVDGPAALTCGFLRGLWQSGGAQVVEEMLNQKPAEEATPGN